MELTTSASEPLPSVRLSAGARSLAIARIMEARFMLSVFEQVRDGASEHWDSPGNAMARGIFGQAMLEKKRLERASDAMLCAELAELPRRR
jgi:hypothetical protein